MNKRVVEAESRYKALGAGKLSPWRYVTEEAACSSCRGPSDVWSVEVKG